MLTRYPLQQGLNPPRNLYVYGSLQELYLWINKQREVGPAIHRTLEFTATALEQPFRTTPHIWRQERNSPPPLWSFRWLQPSMLPGMAESAVVYAMPHGPHAVLVHWNNERGAAAQKRSLEAAVRQAQACLDYVDDTARQLAQATGGGQ